MESEEIEEMIVLSNGKNINPVEIEQWIMANTNLIQEMAVAEVDSVLTAVVFLKLGNLLIFVNLV